MNYERINWEGGTEVEGAYVEIDGTKYPVVMPTYNCDTPITATNLNIMDKGIYDAKNSINEIIQNIIYQEISITPVSGITQVSPIKMYKFGKMYFIRGSIKKTWASDTTGSFNIIKIPTEHAPLDYSVREPAVSRHSTSSVIFTYSNAKAFFEVNDSSSFSSPAVVLRDISLEQNDIIYLNICYMK